MYHTNSSFSIKFLHGVFIFLMNSNVIYRANTNTDQHYFFRFYSTDIPSSGGQIPFVFAMIGLAIHMDISKVKESNYLYGPLIMPPISQQRYISVGLRMTCIMEKSTEWSLIYYTKHTMIWVANDLP